MQSSKDNLRHQPSLLGLAALTLLISWSTLGCGDESTVDASVGCGDGQTVGGVCAYRSALDDGSFACPTDLPVRHDFDGFVVCAATEDLGEETLAALDEAGFETDPADTDPCAGLTLPTCPGACGNDIRPGTGCEVEGEACGNEVGDGCVCRDGAWECTVHAPLSPGQCNLVCREGELDCSTVGCSPAPLCGESCDAECGCCACGEGDTREVEGDDGAVLTYTCDAAEGCFVPPAPEDPCDGLDLPSCPVACTGAAQPGTGCEIEGETCGNDIGDGCTCAGGVWQCTVHPPLSPSECNLVCRD